MGSFVYIGYILLPLSLILESNLLSNVGFIIAGGLGVMYNAKEIGSTDRKRGFIVNLLWVCTVFDSK